MYKVLKIIVKNNGKKKAIFKYFSELCLNYKNLKNVANFHIRQHMTGLKDGVILNPLQESSISLFKEYIPKATEASINNYNKKVEKINKDSSLTQEEKEDKINNLKYKVFEKLTPEKWFPDYYTLEAVLRLSKNVDYYSLPGNVNQEAIKEVNKEWTSFFSLNKLYKENPSSLLGKPKIPKYLKGPTTVTLNNNVCKLKEDEENRYSLRFPKTKEKLSLGSYYNGNEKLVQVEVKPVCNYFVVSITTDTENKKLTKEEKKARKEDNKEKEKELKEIRSNRVIAIDVGMKNIATITNNVGLRPILIKGNVIVSRNKFYLDKIAEEQSIINKGKDPKDKSYKRTNLRIHTLYAKRDRMLFDYFHKIGSYIISFCKDNEIDIIIIGKNSGMKQNMNIGMNNQNFAYIPFERLYSILSYLCVREGIKYVEVEESYTSKASFFDKDVIPTYKKSNNSKEKENYTFSGTRKTRDLYETKNGYILNADVNGSLNIMRKFDEELTFSIQIKDVSRCDVLGYYTFYKKISKNRKRKPCKQDFHKLFENRL